MSDPRHGCGIPGCNRWIPVIYFACGQHRALLGFELSARLQTAYQEKRWDPERFERTCAEAYRVMGWKAGTAHVISDP